jgi:glutathione S-transferase
MKLYWSWFINPQKVRLALNELGLAHEIAELKLLQGEQRRPAHLALNPNGKVPVLQDGDLTLWESNAILVYLGEKEARLWPTSTTSRGEALRWLFFESCHLADPIGTLWFSDFVAEKANLSREEKAAAVQIRAQRFGEAKKAEARAQLDRFLPVVENHLEHHPWMQGDSFGLVDCCYGSQFDVLTLSQTLLSAYPRVIDYVNRVRARPAWSRCEFQS